MNIVKTVFLISPLPTSGKEPRSGQRTLAHTANIMIRYQILFASPNPSLLSNKCLSKKSKQIVLMWIKPFFSQGLDS